MTTEKGGNINLNVDKITLLGSFVKWRGQEPVMETLERLCLKLRIIWTWISTADGLRQWKEWADITNTQPSVS